MKALRLVTWIVLALVLAGASASLESLWSNRDLPVETVDARYSSNASRFIHIDGVRLHVRDEGEGPPMLLIHSEFSNLIDWDPWVAAFSQNFRVIRFDLPAHGLTGPDPSGDYHLERTVGLTRKLIGALKLEKPVLIGAGAGGAVAVEYAADYPDQIDSLVLLSPDGMTTDTLARLRDPEPAALHILSWFMPRTLVRLILASAWGSEPGPDDELVTRWHTLWLRNGQREAQLQWVNQYRPIGIRNRLMNIHAPGLLLWGDADTWNRPPRPDELDRLLTRRNWHTIVYAGKGHLLVEEADDRLLGDIGAWLGIEPPAEAAATVVPQSP